METNKKISLNNKLVFHIGVMKTGTTALQYFLRENEKALNKAGWCYPDFTRELPDYTESVKNEKSKNGIYFYGLDLKNGVDATSDKWECVWECIEAHLQNNNVIISAEEMCLYGAQQILSEAKKRFENVQVIVYLRRQDQLIESVWTQFIKMNVESTFQEFVCDLKNGKKGITDINDLTDVRDILFYYTNIKKIEEIIGHDNLFVRVYEKGQLAGERKDVISDFFSTLGISLEWGDVVEPICTNERLGDGYTEIKRIINMLGNHWDDMNMGEISYDIWKLATKFPRKRKEASYFTPEARREFLEQFNKENELVAKEYLQREDGILFYDNEIDYPQNMIQATLLEEDMIKTFSYMFMKHSKEATREIAQLQCQNKLLIQNMIMLYKGNRKLAYFAAGQRCDELLQNYQLPVEIIFDNCSAKAGEKKNEILITIPEKESLKEYFIVVTCNVTDEIEAQLNELELRKGCDYILAKEMMM